MTWKDETIYCGRPTRYGTPCRAILQYTDLACHHHKTDTDRALQRRIRGIIESGRESDKNHLSFLQGQIDDLRATLDVVRSAEARKRTHDRRGRQLVVIATGHTYHWDGSEPLALGDEVMLPENWVSRMQHGPGPWFSLVHALGSDYVGETSGVLRRWVAAS